MVRGHTKIPGKSVTGTKMGSERDDDIPNFRIKQLFGMDAGRCADKPWQFFCACTVVFLPKW